ncbi:regulatory phage cox family protein [Pectobacterium versatile]|uniref:regulatory phage cox family protein n=1 Tax=Pectobacterium versatile TaxID=2488639 RepID=UPI001F41415E|nr:regulatory phage cox family protein [Pectobacterium versatile]
MTKKITLISDAVPYQEFARLIGKSERAVKGMIEKGKLPVVEMTDPQSASDRVGEYWIYLPAWNNGMKLAYESRPKEIRDGWLMWLGLGEPS